MKQPRPTGANVGNRHQNIFTDVARDQLLERPLPNAQEAERAILGAVLLDNALYYQAADYGITPDVFYMPFEQRVWWAMGELLESGQEINTVLIANILRTEGEGMITQLPVTRLTDYMIGVPHFANVKHFAKLVMDAFWKRTLIKVCNYITAKTLDGEDEMVDVMSEAETGILELANNALRGNTKARNIDFVHILKDKDDFKETLLKRARGESDAIPTGIAPLDAMLEGGGLNPQGFYLVAARPKAGKTSLVLGIAERAAIQFAKWFAEQGIKASVAVASLEMRRQALQFRLFSSYSGIPFDVLSRPGRLKGRDLEKAFGLVDGFFAHPLYITDAVFAIPEFQRACERVVYGEMQARIIIADYVQLFALSKGQAVNPEALTGETTLISRELKHTAQELNVPLVGISSMSRLGELRQSGQLDYDVEALITLENPEWDAIEKLIKQGHEKDARMMRAALDQKPIWDITARLKFQRNGPTGDIPLKFLRRQMQFLTVNEYEGSTNTGSSRVESKQTLGELWDSTGS